MKKYFSNIQFFTLMGAFVFLFSTYCISVANSSEETEKQNETVEFEMQVCESEDQVNCHPRIFQAIDDSDIQKVKQLIDEGVDPNAAYPVYYGTTALMHALQTGKADAALLLIEHGANPTVRVPLDPMQIAIDYGYVDVVRVIEAYKLEQKESEGK